MADFSKEDNKVQRESGGGSDREGGARILCVDDEENILRSLKRLFLDEDLEVLTATSGAEGLKILKEDPDIALIISDQRMPGLTGAEFLEQARRIAPRAGRMLLTGYADIQAAVDAVNRGRIFRYFTKPWQDEELVRTVKEALKNYFLVQENRRLSEVVKKQNAELKKWSSELEIIVQEQTMELQRNYDSLRQLNTRLRANFRNTITAFSGLLELRDRGMRNHAGNVAGIAGRVAGTLGLSSEEKETMMVASLLHDIGKIGIPDVLLQVAPAGMNDDERREYEKHPVRGQAAVDAIEDLREAGEIIRHHHERYDGTGFPDRLKKKEIPRPAKIIAIIDFFDREVRRFESLAGIDLASRAVEEESGKAFDPRLVPLVIKEARQFYRNNLPRSGVVERELAPRDLKIGMVVSRDVYSGTGILLLSKGTALDGTNIQVLRRYYDLDPARHGVFVRMKG